MQICGDTDSHKCAGIDASKATTEWVWNHHSTALCGYSPAFEALPVLHREFQHCLILPMFGMPIDEF